jgi:hypothetical protein
MTKDSPGVFLFIDMYAHTNTRCFSYQNRTSMTSIRIEKFFSSTRANHNQSNRTQITIYHGVHCNDYWAVQILPSFHGNLEATVGQQVSILKDWMDLEATEAY